MDGKIESVPNFCSQFLPEALWVTSVEIPTGIFPPSYERLTVKQYYDLPLV